ncbi:MAG: agmatinase [Thermoanaerobaculales bacterium]|jgi:agmatinase|nr:agmatinase [Thermoanaerobaculales bacterium]
MTICSSCPIVVVGVPSDVNSSYLRGPAAAPKHIREAFHSPSTNLCAENGIDLAARPEWKDVGDLSPGESPEMTDVERGIGRYLDEDRRVVALGGDHAITYPIVRAVASRNSELTILHLDAHPDLYDELDGNRFSHACPFARIMEEQPEARLIQVGIRNMNPHQREQADRFGVEVHMATDLPRLSDLGLDPTIYLSIDLDVLDPAHAPGLSHPEPGGLTTREVITLIQTLPFPPIAADIVELNPERDANGLTAMVAAKLLKEVLGRMLG